MGIKNKKDKLIKRKQEKDKFLRNDLGFNYNKIDSVIDNLIGIKDVKEYLRKLTKYILNELEELN